MKTISLLIATLLLLPGCNAQLKNAHTVTVRVDGDCPMCEKTIEKAAYMKGEAEADWDVDAKTARITYDSTRTSLDVVLQRIAQAGYDSKQYLAPDAAYAALPGCCQYERSFKRAPRAASPGTNAHSDHAGHHADTAEAAIEQGTKDPLAPVFDTYFALKDALVASNATDAQARAKAFDAALRNVEMDAMEHTAHLVWMKVMERLANTSGVIAGTADLAKQRKAFAELTAPMTELAKAAPATTPIYRDHCPMYEGGADWLSRDKAIKNPFYGSQMMTCGSVKETISR